MTTFRFSVLLSCLLMLGTATAGADAQETNLDELHVQGLAAHEFVSGRHLVVARIVEVLGADGGGSVGDKEVID